MFSFKTNNDTKGIIYVGTYLNKTMKDTQYQEKISENKLKNSNQKISWKTQQQKIIIQTKSRNIKTRVKVNSLWCKHTSPNSAV